MTHENVITDTTFDHLKHYQSIYNKLLKFKKDFDINDYINLKLETGLNNCLKCHSQIDEPLKHYQAKNKIFKLFLNDRYYLIETELRANKELYVPGKGNRNYQFDTLVINVSSFTVFMNYMQEFLNIRFNLNDSEKNDLKLDIKMLKDLEQDLIFAIELDGKSHSDKKDYIRDQFFFSTYNIVTVRYKVNQLVNVQETKKERNARLKYNYYREYTEQPIFYNITTEQIVDECRNVYRTKYPFLMK